jgi:hypothetical protein
MAAAGARMAKNAIARRYTDYRVAKLALFIAFVAGGSFPVLPDKKPFGEALFPSGGHELGDARTRWTCEVNNKTKHFESHVVLAATLAIPTSTGTTPEGSMDYRGAIYIYSLCTSL